MRRREFLGACAALLSAPVISEKRVYSFLWDNPLVRQVVPIELQTYARQDAAMTNVIYSHFSSTETGEYFFVDEDGNKGPCDVACVDGSVIATARTEAKIKQIITPPVLVEASLSLGHLPIDADISHWRK